MIGYQHEQRLMIVDSEVIAPPQDDVFGGIIAISSTMVVLKMLLERGEIGSPHGQVLLGMLIVQDLATVPRCRCSKGRSAAHLRAGSPRQLRRRREGER